MVNTTELKKLIRICKKSGIKRAKLGEIEIEFWTQGTDDAPEFSSATAEDTPSDDEMMLYSTDSFDDVRAIRKAAKESVS